MPMFRGKPRWDDRLLSHLPDAVLSWFHFYQSIGLSFQDISSFTPERPVDDRLRSLSANIRKYQPIPASVAKVIISVSLI